MQHPPPEVMEMLARVIGLLAIGGIGFLISVVVACFVLYDAQKRVPPQFRQIEPGMVWLLLIPCFNIVWNFIALPKVSRSYKAYFDSIGRPDVGTCGEGLAIGYAVCVACCVIPCIYSMGLAFLAALVLLIAYLAKILALKAQMPVSDYAAEQENVYRREE